MITTAFEEFLAALFLTLGVIIGKIWEKQNQIEKVIDLQRVKEIFKKDKKEGEEI